MRDTSVTAVLRRVLALNLAVALAKLAFGYATGAVSIISDGFHSLTDAGANLLALAGVRASRKPPDRDHPYGHRKFETLAAVGLFVFLLLVVVEILRAAIARHGGSPPQVTPLSFGVMGGTLLVNLFVVRYETRAAERLSSEVLLADATQTRSDVFTSLGVIAALAGVRLGLPMLDPIAGLMVAVFIGKSSYDVACEISRILADRVVIAEEDLRRVVMSVPDVLGCHHIRTRGTADHVFLDLHVWFPPDTRLDRAHALSHVVKDRLMTRYPQIADAVIHIEPPPTPDGRT